MKIEKINENKIKFLLTAEDLKEREIKLSELAQGTEKAQAFFRDIMRKALDDFGFDASDSPLMIEAMPIAINGVVIIVSKVSNENDANSDINLMPKSLEARKFKQEGIQIVKSEHMSVNKSKKSEKDEEMNIYIYSFATIDDVINLSNRIKDFKNMLSVLYKFNDEYFLLIQEPFSVTNNLDYLLLEYGEKHSGHITGKYHLEEHGEVIIKSEALNILSSL